MNGTIRVFSTAMLVANGLVAFAAAANAQGSQSGQQPQTQSPASTQDPKPADNGTSLAIPAPVNAEEDAAAKAFQAMPPTDLDKKVSAGEDFLKTYPESKYRPMVYSALTFLYLQQGKPEKAFEVGDKEVALKPDDVQTLAVLSQTIPRAINSSTPQPEKQLAKAEQYAKRAIEVTPTIPKPEGVPDQNFIVAKNSTLSMAHGGLGIVYFRRQKYTEAIPELEQSVKIDPNPTPDPVNLYILAVSDQKTSHFDDAAIAFTKCAAIAGGLQAACRSGADEAKKQSATQLSSPK